MTFSLFRLDSLESRIVVFFVVLLMSVQMAGFFAIRYAIEQSARNNLRDELDVGVRVFKRLLEQNSQQLVEATAVLSYDFGFREAVSSQDRDTILSALSNHSARIQANGMALVNLQNVVVADTLQTSAIGKQFAFPKLIASAREQRRSSAIRLINGTIYQIVVVPVLAPLPISWVVMLFLIDDSVATDLKRITSLDVTFVGGAKNGSLAIFATTLTPFLRERLMPFLADIAGKSEARGIRVFGDEEFETLSTTIENYDGTSIVALLQRSLRDGLQPYEQLQVMLLFLAALVLSVSLIGSMRIARRISRPVRTLSAAARRIAVGDYATIAAVSTQQKDEIGELATAFENMSRGLKERDQMRDLLGKVASPAVAAQLLKQKVELGGEERRVTVMFTDIRNFTELCEILTPQQSVELLNRYLARISGVIEKFEGVVDKYTGDGVMALFGAPIGRDDDAERALFAALEIDRQLVDLGRELAIENLPNPLVGIGVNTSRVIAGNIGTATRLNYTVLGDGVNLAARLERLTKRYQVPLVVGQETKERVSSLIYRELDKVRVKGKKVAVRIFQPIGRVGEVDSATMRLLDQYHAAIEAYRNCQWQTAKVAMIELKEVPDYKCICELYLGYIEKFENTAPDKEWDGSFTLYEK